MMKISNNVSEIRAEDISANIELSCIYLIENLYNGKVYVGKGYNATYNYPSIERAYEIVVRFITMWNVWNMRIYSKRT